MMSNILSFRSQENLNYALAMQVKKLIDAAIDKKGQAVVAFSGGSTPIGMLEKLSELSVDWEKVKVTVVDERWVTEGHPASNAGLLKKHLLNQQVSFCFLSLVSGVDTSTAFQAAESINKRLNFVLPPLDLAILGMGGDGHTASFFPGSPQLHQALNPNNKNICIATKPTNANHDRMTLTLNFLLKSQQLILHFTGNEKFSVFLKAQEATNESLPVSFLLHQKTVPVTVYYAE